MAATPPETKSRPGHLVDPGSLCGGLASKPRAAPPVSVGALVDLGFRKKKKKWAGSGPSAPLGKGPRPSPSSPRFPVPARGPGGPGGVRGEAATVGGPRARLPHPGPPPLRPPAGRKGEAAERAQSERKSERARDKPLCRGLTFNRSQRGSCSATYETPTQKQVVYEWFSARFPTNVRCVKGVGAAPFPAAPRFPGRRALRTGPRSRRAAGARAAPAGGATTARRRGRAGDRLSEANRGSRGAAVSFRLGGILT